MKTIAALAFAVLAVLAAAAASLLPVAARAVSRAVRRDAVGRGRGVGGGRGVKGPDLGGEWSRLDACAWLAWDVEFLMADVNAFLLRRRDGVHEEMEEAGPMGAQVVEMARRRVKWSFYAAKGLEKSLAVLCSDVRYEGKAGELVLETFRRAVTGEGQ